MSVTPRHDELAQVANAWTYDMLAGQRWRALHLAAELEEKNADLLSALEDCAQHGLRLDAELRTVRANYDRDVDDLAELVGLLSSKLKSAGRMLLILSGLWLGLLIFQLWRIFG